MAKQYDGAVTLVTKLESRDLTSHTLRALHQPTKPATALAPPTPQLPPPHTPPLPPPPRSPAPAPTAAPFTAPYTAAGCTSTVVHLPDEGIAGNDHFMFQDLNNDVIADHIENWIQQNVQ